MFWIWIIVIVAVVYLAYILYIKPLRIKAYYSKIFKAHGYKVFQYPYQLTSSPFMADWFKNQKQKNDYGYSGKHVYSDSYDVLVSNIFNKPELVFFSDKLLKGFFDKDLQWKLPKMSIGCELIQFMCQKSLTFIEKNTWKHRRSILQKIFNFEFIVSQVPTMIQTADKIFQDFEEQYWTSNPQKRSERQIQIQIYSLISRYTSKIIMVGFLGSGLQKEQLRGTTIQQAILKLTADCISLSRDPLTMMFGTKFVKLGLRKKDRQFLAFNQQVNDILGAYIQKTREEMNSKKQQERTQPKTIVQLVLQNIQKEKNNPNKEAEITDQALIDQIKAFLVAGTDTTANYFTMLLFYIYQHKEVLQRLRKEIQKHVKSDQDITYQNIKKIPYMDIVLMESARMMAASEVGFQRILQQDSSICDIALKKGTCLNYYIRPNLSNPSIFKDPLSFKPERWQPETQQTKKLQQLVSYQFYGGPRGCIGKNLALTETRIMLIKFLRRYKNLFEPGINNRVIAIDVSSHLLDSNAILQKYE